MYHMVYLDSVCQRRNWPNPVYHVSPSRAGYTCIVRVNNREYQTPKQHQSELLAKEAAATTAYSIVANFSANDGMYPAGFASGGVVQGNPVPVGSGRHARRSESISSHQSSTSSNLARYGSRDVSNSPGSRSGHSSPDSPAWSMPAGERNMNRHHVAELSTRHQQDSLRRHQGAPRQRHRY